MNPSPQLSVSEFRTSLTPEILRPIQIIQGALIAGPLMFFVMVLLVASTTPGIPAEQAETSLVFPLTGVAIIVSGMMFTVGRILYHSRFNRETLRGSEPQLPENVSPAMRGLAVIREAMLIRGAVLEGSAFFGLAVMIIAATGGVFFSLPYLWLNAIPLAINTLYGILNFPTVDNLTAVFEQKFK